MFEQEKKLEDYQKQNKLISRKDFDSMSYEERCQLLEERPDEYRRLAGRGTGQKKQTAGFRCSSQVKR